MNEDLKVVISAEIDKLKKGCQDAQKEVQNFSKQSSSVLSKFGDAMKSAGKKAGEIAVATGKAVAKGLAVGAGAIAALGTASIKSYSNYEQLVGGVETLFGKSANTIQKYANEAYKTAGMSANQYMETVTGFSASLLQSLGGDTAKAAEYGNQAVIDMSDNANKMGTDISSIQNAYQGFAKQNYTMLDNLKLGYGGTKEEMQRLLTDAEKLTGKKFDVSNFGDITEAIHAIQTEMGITGTTAKEASTTIQGSLASVKGAWENLLTGLADGNQDISGLVTNMAESVFTAIDNILPKVQVFLEKVPQLVTELVPKLLEKVNEIVDAILPSVVSGAESLLKAVVDALPKLIDVIAKNLPKIIEAVVSIASMIVNKLPQIIKSICDALPNLASTLASGIVVLITTLVDNMESIISPILECLPSVISAICEALPEILPQLVEGFVTLIVSLMEYLPDIIQPIIDNLPNIIISVVEALVENLPALIEGLITLMLALVENLPTIIQSLIDALPTVITLLINAVITNLPLLIQGAIQLVLGIVQALPEIIKALVDALPQIIGAIVKGLLDCLPMLLGCVVELVAGIGECLWELLQSVIDIVIELLVGCWNSICEVFSVVGTWFYDNVIKPVCDFFSGLWEDVTGFFQDIWDDVCDIFDGLANWFNDNVIQPICNFFEGLKTTVENIWNGLWEGIKGVINGIIGGINGMISGVCAGINFLIRAMNQLHFDIPDWVPLLGGKSFGFSITEITAPQIPLLANGGLLDKPTLNIAGESGREAVIPLDKDTGAIELIATKLAEKISGGNQPIYLTVDGKVFAQTAVSTMNDLTKQSGNCGLVLA